MDSIDESGKVPFGHPHGTCMNKMHVRQGPGKRKGTEQDWVKKICLDPILYLFDSFKGKNNFQYTLYGLKLAHLKGWSIETMWQTAPSQNCLILGTIPTGDMQKRVIYIHFVVLFKHFAAFCAQVASFQFASFLIVPQRYISINSFQN